MIPCDLVGSKVLANANDSVISQSSDNQNPQQAEQLLKEANYLQQKPEQFGEALAKYEQALVIYRQQKNESGAKQAFNQLELALTQFEPLALTKRDQIQDQINTFLSKYPQSEDNQTAIKLQKITATELGFQLKGISSDETNYPVAPAKKEEFEQIKSVLNDYLESQVISPVITIDQPPTELIAYLEKYRDSLDKIKKLILDSEPLQWSLDISSIKQGNLEAELPTYFGLVHLEKLLLLDILYQQQLDRKSDVNDSLTVAWQLTQSLRSQPVLFSQLMSIIMVRFQAGVIRKLEHLDSQWQPKLLEHDYRQSVISGLDAEAYALFSFYSNQKPIEIKKLLTENELTDLILFNSDIGWENWSESLQKSYFLWKAIAHYQQQSQIYEQLATNSICDRADLLTKLNLDENSYYLTWINQWIKGNQRMLELEFTQKILQVQALSYQNKEIPSEVKLSQSNYCPNTEWLYQKLSPQQWLLLANPVPAWGIEGQDLPFSFSFDDQ